MGRTTYVFVLLFVGFTSACTRSSSSASPTANTSEAPAASFAFVDAGSPDAGADDAGIDAGMAFISGGAYDMGVDGHRVSVGSFYLDVSEVTVDDYAACVAAGKCTDGVRTQLYDRKDQGPGACNFGVAGRGNHPINCVDWNQASSYCRAQGKRLPTEQEWEWAARGETEARKYPWGNSDDVRACWSGSENRTGTCAVGSFPAGDGRGGLHDMAGNVLEWTSSISGASDRVVRGGSWRNDDASILRVSYRFASATTPTDRTDELGFRCALRVATRQYP